jgi:hypothetical protein
MEPESAPPLKGKCAKEFIKAIEKPLNSEQRRIFEKAESVSNAIRKKE